MSKAHRQYIQIRKDLQYIKDTYGDLYDYCGAFCNNYQFSKLLDSPSLSTAVEIYRDYLRQYLHTGYETLLGTLHRNYVELPRNDKRLSQIAKRWGLEAYYGYQEGVS